MVFWLIFAVAKRPLQVGPKAQLKSNGSTRTHGGAAPSLQEDRYTLRAPVGPKAPPIASDSCAASATTKND
jgi:hypothetical protein